jgi:hypothetical protein
MTKKLNRLEDWLSASDAASLLSDKMGFPIDPKYIARLARSKKQPVKTRPVSGHLLYLKADIERCKVRKKAGDA